MKILFIHNAYGKYSGEEAVVDAQMALLASKGHTVELFSSSSADLEKSKIGKLIAFFTGLYNPKSIFKLKRVLRKFKPDVVHVHNLYPFISPSVLPAIKKMRIPVVMTVHNFRLICPNGLFFTHGTICEKCTGKGKEINCIKNNCESSLPKSVGYALRNYWARKRKYFLNNVDNFMCLNNFQRMKLIQNGFPENKISVLPNFYSNTDKKENISKKATDHAYVAWAGRISPEKGINLLFEAAKLLPQIEFRVAGNILPGYDPGTAPENVILLGMLDKEKLEEFYSQASFLVMTSIWYEGFPMILPEAMRFRLPVIIPKLGGLPEIVKENVSGLSFEPGNCTDLADKIRLLWDNKDLCIELGNNGYERLRENFSAEVFYKRILEMYEKVSH